MLYLGAMLKWVLLLFTGVAWAHDLGKPVALVASPAVVGGYAKTVLVGRQLESGWHLGFVVNRSSGIYFSELLPDSEAAARVREPLYIGGPQGTGDIRAIVRAAVEPPDALHLFADVWLILDADEVARIIEQDPNSARYFAGYVLWPPGVLRAEVAAGAWYVTEPRVEHVFCADPDRLWEKEARRLGNVHPPQRELLDC